MDLPTNKSVPCTSQLTMYITNIFYRFFELMIIKFNSYHGIVKLNIPTLNLLYGLFRLFKPYPCDSQLTMSIHNSCYRFSQLIIRNFD